MAKIKTDKKLLSIGRPDLVTSLGLVSVIIFFVVSGIISYANVRILQADSQAVVHTHQVITGLGDLLSIMKDAETGQRGYLITGETSYLRPYTTALTDVDERFAQLQQQLEPSSVQAQRLPDMKAHMRDKLDELAETIELRRSKGFDAAKAVVLTDKGKNEMDALRKEVQMTQTDEETLRDKRIEEMANAYRSALTSGVLTGLLGVVLSVLVALLVRRSNLAKARQEWLQTGQVGLAEVMVGEQRVEQLGTNVLAYLCEYLDAQVGVFFAEEGGHFSRVASYGLTEKSKSADRFAFGEGLLGQAAKDRKPFVIHNVPEGYISVGSGLGHANPNQLIIAPTIVDGQVNAVLEFGFLHRVNPLSIELLELADDTIAVALRSAVDRLKLQELLQETQQQGEELQVQGEELRISNEELEEQSRALKESQARLEQQQAELEQTNSQLEEQTQMLEIQRDDLNQTRIELEAKAKDLERTSRFKSDFLANMSHELRTPLNSSLILAKLLADNREGNLSAEQIKYAQTIQSAGNDLLALISDILDLSKIEAGHMEVEVERVRVTDLVKGISNTFEPIANQKSLKFQTQVDPGVVEFIETDTMRLEQVLRNLLSNAMKFTEKGQVSLVVRPAPASGVAFAVKDTGIGIPPHQREMVFEAFRQADGTTNRKYGGTGLGLSISLELAHLLGGSITLESEPGQGSEFTVVIPELLKPSAPSVDPVPKKIMEWTESPLASIPATVEVPVRPNRFNDDRDRVTNNGRLVLAVEDDESFARILLDLAHEQGFQCLLASTADEGLSLASEFLPSAVLLDIGLPDNSGLSVLDRMKHDARTRHIPVHVVSGRDYEHTAKAMGAVGYMLKPVKREDLVQAFEALENRLSQRLRQVLVVEDDEVQLESMRLLLGSRDVQVVGARTAAECLEALRSSTFDCVVLDLSLPDASGFALLEKLDQEEDYSFPPVIVYTGRELSADQEQKLRKHSRSIIVKGAKSPERLLDEVTLFLHQVVADLPAEKRQLLETAKNRDTDLENRRILVVEDDIRNIFALTSILEPRGATIEIARNGREALEALERTLTDPNQSVDLVLMDIMMPEMDGLTAMRAIRKRPEWKRLPIIALTAKAMKNDQEECLEAGANDYIAKPLDVEKLLSLVRVWMPRE